MFRYLNRCKLNDGTGTCAYMARMLIVILFLEAIRDLPVIRPEGGLSVDRKPGTQPVMSRCYSRNVEKHAKKSGAAWVQVRKA